MSIEQIFENRLKSYFAISTIEKLSCSFLYIRQSYKINWVLKKNEMLMLFYVNLDQRSQTRGPREGPMWLKNIKKIRIK